MLSLLKAPDAKAFLHQHLPLWMVLFCVRNFFYYFADSSSWFSRMICLSDDVMTFTWLEMLIFLPHLLQAPLCSSVASCSLSFMVDNSVVSSAYLMSKLMLVSGLSCLCKLFRSAKTNSKNKLSTIGESKQEYLTSASTLNHSEWYAVG